MITKKNDYPAPIVIGAIGGSGTRVVAGILSEMQISIGSYLNTALDNHFFTYFFRHKQIRSMSNKNILLLIELFTAASLGPARILNDEEFDLFQSIYK